MSFQIEISSVAKAEADAALLRIAQLTSVEQGQEWYSELIKVINSLSCKVYQESKGIASSLLQLN